MLQRCAQRGDVTCSLRLVRASEGRLKVGHIQGYLGAGSPGQALHACVDVGVRSGQGASQLVQQVT